MHTYLCFGAVLLVFFTQWKELFATFTQNLDAVCGFWLLAIYFITVIGEAYNTGQGLSKCCVGDAQFTLTDTTRIS